MADQLEGRNPIFECFRRGRRRVLHIWLDQGAKPDDRITAILDAAAKRRVPIDRVDRRKLDELAEGRVHNGIVARVEDLPSPTARELIDSIQGRDPFLILADGLSYEHNLGAILRTSLGFGVDGIIVPTRRGASVSPVVQRVAMGAAEEIPLVHEGLFSALKYVQKAGIRVIGADMGGTPLGQVDLRGPIALVMGSEGDGLSPTLRQRCDQIVSVPLAGQLESLNVSVAASILVYEKRRQDGWFSVPTPA